MPFCHNCKTVVRDDSGTCGCCGLPVARILDASRIGQPKAGPEDWELDVIYPGEKKKSPTITVILNFLVAGLGQVYLGQFGKGFIFAAPTLIELVFRFSLANSYATSKGQQPLVVSVVQILFIFAQLGFRIVAIVDGVLVANKLNQDKVVGKWEWLR